MKETGATSRPVPPNHSDIRRAQVLQPPDSSSDILRGSYLVSEQSPASSQLSHTGTLVSYINTPVCVKGVFKFFQRSSANFPRFSVRFLWAPCQGGIVQRRTAPAFAARCFPVMPQGRGLPLPLTGSAVFYLTPRRGGSQTRPSSMDHDTRRARRLGAPHLAGFRPAGRVPLPTAAKGPKRRWGCPSPTG